MLVTKSFVFHAAHRLTGEKMKEPVHGHSYRLEVCVSGPVDSEGVVLDFRVLKKLVEEKVIKELDHTDLNKTLDQPTAENIAAWIWKRLAADLHLHEVRLWETASSFVTVRSGDI